MAQTAPRARVTMRSVACHAVTSWYSESAILVSSFAYPAEAARAPATVAEQIEATLGISTTPPRFLLGDVDLAWRDERRLESIELRTGRDQWERVSLSSTAAVVEEAWISLEADYDVNRVASVDVDVRVLWDEERSQLALHVGTSDTSGGRWVAIADTVHVCIGQDEALLEIRFADVRLEE